MSFEIRPLGVQCNLRCQYCYQNPERDAEIAQKKFDREVLLKRVREADEPFSMFGGEPLLTPLDDLEALWAAGYERWGQNSIQTNATLVTDHHLRLFERYNVSVGISMDGPGVLNDGRWAGSLEKTRSLTARSERAIERLCQAGIETSMIVTLHQLNASKERLPLLLAWLGYLDRVGVRTTRLHVLEVDDPAVEQAYALSPEENLETLLQMEQLEGNLVQMQLDVFGEMTAMLMGRDNEASCVWRACDPYTTEAVQGLEGHGGTSNCGRTNKDGVGFEKAAAQGFERYLALYYTPQADGGCRDCRFFLMCKGQCPGTSIEGDWRMRTNDCETWKKLFVHLEKRMQESGEQPLSLHPWRQSVENMMLQAWASGQNPSIQMALLTLSGSAELVPANEKV